MLNPKTYQTPNAIDPGEAPPSRPSRRVSTADTVDDVRLNAARLLQASDDRRQSRPSTSRQTIPIRSVGNGSFNNSFNSNSFNNNNNNFPYDRDDDTSLSHTATTVPTTGNSYDAYADAQDRTDEEEGMMTSNGASLPSVEEARLYAGRILSKSSRDLSPESSERARLTSMEKGADQRTSFRKGIPLITPPHIVEKRKRLMRRCMYVILGMAFLAVLVGLSVHISHAQKKNSQSTSTARTNNAPTTTTQDQQPIGPSVRLTQTNDFLTRYSISHGDNLKDLTTPQYLAAVWIADHDVLTYKIPDSPNTDYDAYMNFVQRYVLAVFYFSTNGHGWKNQDLFLDKAHECAWYTPDHLVDGEVVALGVTCDNEGQVSALLMPRNSLSGSLPTELGHLSKLSFVDLNRNAIAGSIPDEFDRLIDMEFFDLRYNKVTGHLPLWIGARWPELKALSLSNNHMSGVLPESMSGNLQLKTLSLANNNFTASLNPIMKLKSLEFLYLEKNRFEGNVDDEFLQDMENLVQVDISSNDLGGQDLPLHLFQHSSLQVLDLSDNSIMGTIPLFNILDNTAMQYLGLSDNILTGSLPESIVKLKSLRHLDVTGNDLIGTMPASLAGMPKLTYVFLSENGFDKGPIPDFFGDMKQLRELSLSGTQRTGALPSEWLGELNHLVLFDVSYNEMTGSIPSVIWEHPNLSYLLLNRNKFTGDLPAGISDDTKLNMLLLDNNSITGDLTEACQKLKIDWLIADCQEISCECCKCCADNEPRCNDDILYANNDFSWEYNYTRVAYAFSPEILFEATPKVRTTVGH